MNKRISKSFDSRSINRYGWELSKFNPSVVVAYFQIYVWKIIFKFVKLKLK